MVTLATIHDEILKCKKCPLWKTRTHAVPGEGNPASPLMFIGEAPGRTEDETGRPFVGRAGKILTEALKIAGVTRKDVFITSILKCRPPGNRTPKMNEIYACTPYTVEQIRIIAPKVIVPLGNVAIQWLNRTFNLQIERVNVSRGSTFRESILRKNIVILPTFHPAYVLRNIKHKPVFIEDVKKSVNIAFQ